MVTNLDLHLHSQNRRIEEKNVFRQIDPLLWASLFYNIQDKNWNIAICANLYLFRGLLWTLIEVYILEKDQKYCVKC